MRSEAPPLMPIFRSRHQADLLAWLLLHPDQSYTTTELSKRLEVPLTTLHREVQRLVAAGLLRDWAVGRSRLLRADTEHPAYEPLVRLLALSFGPRSIVEDEFAGLEGAEQVLIFGSWAARYQGTEGPSPADVDVLVVGNPARGEVYEAADRAQDRLGMPVNPVVRTVAQWSEGTEALIAQIRSAPLLVVHPAPVSS
jgi:predicted nucleotidyltransferase